MAVAQDAPTILRGADSVPVDQPRDSLSCQTIRFLRDQTPGMSAASTPRSDTELYNYLGVSRCATAALLRSFGRQTTLGYVALRFPFSQIFPGPCFNDEPAFSCKWPHNRKLAVQACAEHMELCRCLWWFSPRNDFGRVHFPFRLVTEICSLGRRPFCGRSRSRLRHYVCGALRQQARRSRASLLLSCRAW